MDAVLLIKPNTAVYDCYSFLFSWLETDKNPAAFKLLKSRRLNSIFSVDNHIELVPLKSVEQGFFKWPVFCRFFLLLFFSSIHFLSVNRTVLWKNWKDHQEQILPQILKKGNWIRSMGSTHERKGVPWCCVPSPWNFSTLNTGFFKDLASKEHFHLIVQPHDEWLCRTHTTG